MNLTTTTSAPATLAASERRRALIAGLGMLPFFLFALLFLILPLSRVVVRSFQTDAGAFTLQNFGELSRDNVVTAYVNSIKLSAITAVMGGILGFGIAFGVSTRGMPAFVRPLFITFSGVASNFAGVPLAFAFISTVGRLGLVTIFLRDVLSFDLYKTGFSVFSFAGLSLTYTYFQFPLMMLVITPALEGLKKEWREASENLGASTFQYWRYVGFPILMPSLLATMLLLFGNAFGAYATAYALTGGNIALVTILIGDQIKGDVLHNIGLGNALALGMVAIMSVAIGLATWLRRRSERWLK